MNKHKNHRQMIGSYISGVVMILDKLEISTADMHKEISTVSDILRLVDRYLTRCYGGN